MRRCALVLAAMLLGGTADAHRNTGTYKLGRTRAATVWVNGKVAPPCKPEKPAPVELTIDYAGPDAPMVIVNGAKWRRAGLTTNLFGDTSRRPFRIADRPDPPSGSMISVLFRRDDAKARGRWSEVVGWPGRRDFCATSYDYEGQFRP